MALEALGRMRMSEKEREPARVKDSKGGDPGRWK